MSTSQEIAENRERLDEELTALAAIYGDELLESETGSGDDKEAPLTPRQCRIRLVINDSRVIQFRLYFPVTYPSQHPPVVEWLSAAQLIPADLEASISAASAVVGGSEKDPPPPVFPPGFITDMLPALVGIPLTPDLLADLSAAFDETWETNRGEVVVYQWLAWLETYLRDRWAALPSVMDIATSYCPRAGPPDSSTADANQSPSTNSATPVVKTDTTAPHHSAQHDFSKLVVAHLHSTPGSVFNDLPPPVITTGGRIEDRHSVFVTHVSSVASVHQAQYVVWRLLQDRKVARATHNIVAYRIRSEGQGGGGGGGIWLQDYDDDGESAAGGRLLHLLQLLDVTNVVVVVTRWYGGIQLGPDRFKHINNSARLTLESAGQIPPRASTHRSKKGH